MALKPCKIAVLLPTTGPRRCGSRATLAKLFATNAGRELCSARSQITRGSSQRLERRRHDHRRQFFDDVRRRQGSTPACCGRRARRRQHLRRRCAPKVVLLQYNGCATVDRLLLPKDVLILREFALTSRRSARARSSRRLSSRNRRGSSAAPRRRRPPCRGTSASCSSLRAHSQAVHPADAVPDLAAAAPRAERDAALVDAPLRLRPL